ncbi:hypothetical protein JVU11DRAFT_11290 [Chiua virens]|nr:hypothetical protein JVU11DRAFT_11290 [Chiua virens]
MPHSSHLWMMTSINRWNAQVPSPYAIGRFTSKIPMREYAISSVRVVVLLDAHDILSRMRLVPGLKSRRSEVGIFVTRDTLVMSSFSFHKTSSASAQAVPVTSTRVLKRDAGCVWKVHDANVRETIPVKHRPDRFIELRTAGFVDAARIRPSKSASKLRRSLAKIDQLVIASGEWTTGVHNVIRRLSLLEPSMGQYGESKEISKSLPDFVLGHAGIFVKAKDAAQLGFKERGKLGSGHDLDLEILRVRFSWFNMQQVSGQVVVDKLIKDRLDNEVISSQFWIAQY